MKFHLTVIKTLLAITISLGLASFSTSALASFSTDVKSYTSTQLTTSGDADRDLYYGSKGSAQFVFTEKGSDINLTGRANNVENIFAVSQVPSNSYAREKRLLASESVVQVNGLLAQLGDINKSISAVQETLKTEPIQEKKSNIMREELAPLKAQKNSIESQISKLNTQIAMIENMSFLSILDLFKSRPVGQVLVLHQGHLYLLRSNIKAAHSKNPIASQSGRAKIYNYMIDASIKVGEKSAQGARNKALMKVELSEYTVLSFEFSGTVYSLLRIEDQSVRELVALAKKLPTVPTKFSFKDDVLTTTYQWNKSANEKLSLSVEYKESGKKKNLIQVKTTAETQLYDPKTLSGNIEKHIGILALTKSGSLLELKKVQKTSDKTDGGWVFDHKKRLIKLGSEVLFVEKENYYGFEGLWYLTYVMADRGIASQKIYLINGLEPIALTATLKSNKVEITKAGKVLYRFTLDSSKFITKFEFVPMNQSLELVSRDTRATIKNRQTLKAYMKNNGVIAL